MTRDHGHSVTGCLSVARALHNASRRPSTDRRDPPLFLAQVALHVLVLLVRVVKNGIASSCCLAGFASLPVFAQYDDGAAAQQHLRRPRPPAARRSGKGCVGTISL